jgi:hypothetical protein
MFLIRNLKLSLKLNIFHHSKKQRDDQPAPSNLEEPAQFRVSPEVACALDDAKYCYLSIKKESQTGN